MGNSFFDQSQILTETLDFGKLTRFHYFWKQNIIAESGGWMTISETIKIVKTNQKANLYPEAPIF